jgi:hypothetical protein
MVLLLTLPSKSDKYPLRALLRQVNLTTRRRGDGFSAKKKGAEGKNATASNSMPRQLTSSGVLWAHTFFGCSAPLWAEKQRLRSI